MGIFKDEGSMNLDINYLKRIYEEGKNIIEYLSFNYELSREEVIKVSYDLQAGSYTRGYKNNLEYAKCWGSEISNIINKHVGVKFENCMEVGVGEGTTLVEVSRGVKACKYLGFDISVSRLLWCKKNLDERQLHYELFRASLFEIPLESSSVDIVYTSHSLEPNGGKEREAIVELARVARKAVVLIEPCYEIADAEGKARMEKHGYVRNLPHCASELGFNVVAHGPMLNCVNSLNPSAFTVILLDKSCSLDEHLSETRYAEPGRMNCPLRTTIDGGLYSEVTGNYFPSVQSVKLLMSDDSIFISQYLKMAR